MDFDPTRGSRKCCPVSTLRLYVTAHLIVPCPYVRISASIVPNIGPSLFFPSVIPWFILDDAMRVQHLRDN
ncbi:hypothetical protein J6590_041495 [Homalodisca vitripennis]|nr:hypothetical protein J6590_041495 [Homalodisca vitripennis]